MATVGAVLSGLAGYWSTYRSVATISETRARSPAASAAAPLSILVLPFSNETGDDKKNYIADALTTSVTGDLARIRDAFVLPAATAFTYKNKGMTVQQVGKDAAVRFVLSGSVIASGEVLRITAQLSDAEGGAQLWNETFEGGLGNLFALQDQVTTRIGNTIGEHMVISAARASEMRPNSSRVDDLIKGNESLFTNLGGAYLAMGDNDAAIEWLLKAADAGAEMNDVCSDLVIAYSNKGDIDRARHFVEEFKRRAPSYGFKGIDSNPLPADAPPAYAKYYREHDLPEWKKAGLP